MEYCVKDIIIETNAGTNLAYLRRLRGYTQAILSNISGVSLRSIQQYESGARDIRKASNQTLMMLARALECPIEKLVDVYIDRVTECIIERKNNVKYDTRFEIVSRKISEAEAQSYMRNGWKFDWHKIQELGYTIIELYTPHDNRTQGRLSYSKKEGFYYVDHVENAPFNVGHEGLYEGVGANLFAIACFLSKKDGYGGYVSFYSKLDERLIESYKEKLHAKQVGSSQLMIIDEVAAEYLIAKYNLE